MALIHTISLYKNNNYTHTLAVIVTDDTTDRKVTEYETDNHLFCIYNFYIDFV